MDPYIRIYNSQLNQEDQAICDMLAEEISQHLPDAENKIWHAHPVWFIEKNPIVGYSRQKAGIRLMFWSGSDFEEEKLKIIGAKFKDASIYYNSISQIDKNDLKRWLEKSMKIQWDYKNIIKRKGILIRLK
ncbi:MULTISPECIES: DUF1801 domain-containing protein [unclassified Sphingobacterium]|jgi:uncharacterized protein YdhG (YjbR/CyaY superfamily)|uniref:DUF1801 domain-containing protein n=1 Tax=unclassified Sphingobacterium TaxID=2609468 RepID=UPI0010447824|nr:MULTISPECIES: DUF1801 domain-containing protein [unclassified Sphingobacterium]MCS3554908.1 uncharacterized protein YdhG (YjbR/CyaY superfamily) [Sphingobacterium sp. JUb21]TCR05695.1 uncharacterized protein DUF1801 [Sphingobacterium sp. JUb20]